MAIFRAIEPLHTWKSNQNRTLAQTFHPTDPPVYDLPEKDCHENTKHYAGFQKYNHLTGQTARHSIFVYD